jgi:hypothetical protein
MKTAVIRTAAVSAVLALFVAPLAQATSAANLTTVNNAVAYLKTQQAADGHIGGPGSDTGWSAVALAATGLDLDSVKTSGGTSLRAFLQTHAPADLDKATDWERSIIAITAGGDNPYDFGGVNYVAKVKTYVNSGQLGLTTASNDDYFGLIALLASHTSTSDSLVKSELAYILTQQRSDGGFSYSTDIANGSDTNDTAAAIMALHAAQTAGLGSADVTSALTDAKAYLLGTQNTDGGFPFDPLTPPDWGGPVSDGSSTSWVLMALNALGASSSTAGLAAQTYLRTLPLADGSFPSYTPGKGDVLDTAPAVTALAGGKYPLNVFDGTVPQEAEVPIVVGPHGTPTPTPNAQSTPTPSPTPAGAVLGDAVAPTPTPAPAPSLGKVLGATALPAVGEVSNLILLEIALGISLLSGAVIYLLQRRRRFAKVRVRK